MQPTDLISQVGFRVSSENTGTVEENGHEFQIFRKGLVVEVEDRAMRNKLFSILTLGASLFALVLAGGASVKGF